MKTPFAGVPKALPSIITVLGMIVLGLVSAPVSSAAVPTVSMAAPRTVGVVVGFDAPTLDTPQVGGPIATEWRAAGGASGPLGNPTGVEITLTSGGTYQTFENGAIYQSAASGAHMFLTSSPVYTLWKATWADIGPMHYPTADAVTGLTNGGSSQQFQGGMIYWSPAPGAHLSTNGPIRSLWTSNGSENGTLGYPTSELIQGLVNWGAYQTFQGGAIYWSSPSGAHSVLGDFLTFWKAAGADTSLLGYPTSDKIGGLTNGGYSQQFQNGAIYGSPASGTHSVAGDIWTAWKAAGGQNGKLGYPTSERIGGLANRGYSQPFQGGTIYYSPASRAHVSTGGIRGVWLKFGAQDGKLGYPTSEEIGGLVNGGVYQTYQGGVMYWSPATGAHTTTGGIRSAWARFGLERGKLGYPTSDEIGGLRNGGVYQTYQGGIIYWSPASGAHVTTGGIRSTWAKLGYEGGRMGYPTSDEYAITGGVRQSYQGGYIDYSPRYGVSVHFRNTSGGLPTDNGGGHGCTQIGSYVFCN